MMITGKARIAGVMGWPADRSRSPQLHNFWLDPHGIGMLLHQARPAFAAWFGRRPEVGTALRAHVLAGLE